MSLLVVIPSRPEAQALAAAVPAGVDTLVCGVGVVAAALNVERALAQNRRPVLLVGLAGTRDETKVAVGGLVEATMTVNEAVGAGFGAGFVDLEGLAIPGENEAVDRLQCVDVNSICFVRGAEMARRGPVGTVGLASGSPADAAGWRARHPDVLAEEMEGWGVALAARRAGVPLAMVRSISNVAGDRDHSHWAFDEAFEALRGFLDSALGGGAGS